MIWPCFKKSGSYGGSPFQKYFPTRSGNWLDRFQILYFKYYIFQYKLKHSCDGIISHVHFLLAYLSSKSYRPKQLKTTRVNIIKCIEMCCQNKCTDTWARKRIPQGGLRLHDWKWWHHSWWHQIWWHLVALAVSLDGNGIKFGLGDDGNLGVKVDAKNWK